jgi:hypothetical protein
LKPQRMYLMLIHGLNFSVNWRNFVVGASFFVPCLDADEALMQILRTTKRLRYKVKTQIVVEKGIQGLRVWRIK